MPHFTKTVETGYGSMNFYFNRIFTAQGDRYHISAIARDRKAVIFHMEKMGHKWVLIQSENPPDWLANIESKLSQAIIEHRNNV